MPALSAPAKVLVTGANGFVGVWIVKTLLEAGYAIRGTVRTPSKGEHLKTFFAGKGDFEVVIVDDITKEGAFDQAVQGVDLVVHSASPFHFKAIVPDDLIVPAVKGTVGILESVKKFGTSVKRIVITGSCASVFKPSNKPEIFDETSWNEPAIKEVKEKGAAAPVPIMYRASKMLAEQAAWEFYEKNKSSIPWDLVVLLPPFVSTPPIQDVPSLNELNQSMQDLYDSVVLGKRGDAALLQGFAWVDVRDLAVAHKLALETEGAKGERIIISSGPYFWQTLVDVANSITPAPLPNLAKGKPELIKGKPFPLDYSTAKMTRIFGFKPRGLEEMMRDSLEQFARIKAKA
ncbi:D-lactaldehyde dehydrogenase [Multifurca ochricompacta]|uniref:D-lactaldehyde dehydrogenase n=1 Tax=Multifurca ochricompacta TaxID=376703 RepID=A0AAD4QE54_9AGAM|nr:D-lactaldehyde dehydrogenase [Multifurca ochricompacta]